jgi:hypothetical protein
MVAASSLIISVSIHGHYLDYDATGSYQTTTFMTASAAGFAGSVFLILGMK